MGVEVAVEVGGDADGLIRRGGVYEPQDVVVVGQVAECFGDGQWGCGRDA